MSCAAATIGAIVFSKGAPYRKPLYTNGIQFTYIHIHIHQKQSRIPNPKFQVFKCLSLRTAFNFCCQSWFAVKKRQKKSQLRNWEIEGLKIKALNDTKLILNQGCIRRGDRFEGQPQKIHNHLLLQTLQTAFSRGKLLQKFKVIKGLMLISDQFGIFQNLQMSLFPKLDSFLVGTFFCSFLQEKIPLTYKQVRGFQAARQPCPTKTVLDDVVSFSKLIKKFETIRNWKYVKPCGEQLSKA